MSIKKLKKNLGLYLSLASFLPSLLNAQAEIEGPSSFNERTLWLGGAFTVGAIGGAVTGAILSRDHSRSSKGKSNSEGTGQTGPIGPEGPAGVQGVPGPQGIAGPTGPFGPGPFIADVGETLNFTLTATVFTDVSPASITLIPFVVLPDGLTVEGIPVITSTTDPITFALITIPDPMFGTYQTGVLAISSEEDILIIDFSGSVAASRNGSTTSIIRVTCDAGPFQGEITNTFAYGPENIP